MPNSLAAAICRITACIDTFTAGIAILWPSLKSLIDLIAGSRTSSISGETLKPVAPFTSIGVPLVFDQTVMMPGMPRQTRSEEHTSELQSLRHLVCRLLLEKK